MRSFAGAKDDMSGILFTNRVAEFHIVVEKGINVKKGEEAGWLPLVFCNGGFILPDGGISPPACPQTHHRESLSEVQASAGFCRGSRACAMASWIFRIAAATPSFVP